MKLESDMLKCTICKYKISLLDTCKPSLNAGSTVAGYSSRLFMTEMPTWIAFSECKNCKVFFFCLFKLDNDISTPVPRINISNLLKTGTKELAVPSELLL